MLLESPMEKVCPGLCAVKCVCGCNVFLPAVPRHPKECSICQWLTTYASSFCSRSWGFQRWSPETSSKPNNSSHCYRSPTKQSSYARNKREPGNRLGPALRERRRITKWLQTARELELERKERERERGEGFHPVSSKCNWNSQKGGKKPEACTPNSRADSAEIRLSRAEKPDIAWVARHRLPSSKSPTSWSTLVSRK